MKLKPWEQIMVDAVASSYENGVISQLEGTKLIYSVKFGKSVKVEKERES